MTPKEVSQKQHLQLTNRLLKANSFKLYCKILSALFDSQREHLMLKPLSDALRRKDWPALLAHAGSLSEQKYSDATQHFVANQFALLIKKFPWDPNVVGTDPKQAAIDSFMQANNRCKRVNSKFGILSIDPSQDKFREEGKRAMNWIRSVIGSVPNYKAIFKKCDYGVGASVGVHGDATHVLRKLSDEQMWTVTPGALHHAFGGIMSNFHYVEKLLDERNGIVCLDYQDAFNKYLERIDVVNYNKLGFVAKTAKTERSIATEPLLNGFYQKGVDLELRRKLLNIGLNLGDQSLNQRMALKGSLDDSEDGFVTLDLKNASNSIAYGPVKYLLPSEWFSLLWKTRSPNYQLDGVVKPYFMLCSMGNGFCFPIETLMFASICHACGAGIPGVDFSVYGDDIIVRKSVSSKVIAMLLHYGYKLNTEKSFTDGPFRESCGADWFSGEDVRPFTLDYSLDCIESIFKLCNLTQRNERTSRFFAPVRDLITKSVPSDFRFFRPLTGPVDSGIDSLGDEHLTCEHVTFNRVTACFSWKILHHEPVIDLDRLRIHQNEPWLMGIVLRGTSSIPYGKLVGLPKITFRRKTLTKIARESYSSTSNWLPASCIAHDILH